MGTLPRASSQCGTLPYQRSSYGLSTAALYVDSYRLSGEPVFSHRHSGLLDREVTRTPSIESIHKDPRCWRAQNAHSHRESAPERSALNELRSLFFPPQGVCLA